MWILCYSHALRDNKTVNEAFRVPFNENGCVTHLTCSTLYPTLGARDKRFYLWPAVHPFIRVPMNIHFCYETRLEFKRNILCYWLEYPYIIDSGFESRLVPLCKALYHTCFIWGQRCKWWSRRPKLTPSVISDVKPIIYIFFYIYRLLLSIVVLATTIIWYSTTALTKWHLSCASDRL